MKHLKAFNLLLESKEESEKLLDFIRNSEEGIVLIKNLSYKPDQEFYDIFDLKRTGRIYINGYGSNTYIEKVGDNWKQESSGSGGIFSVFYYKTPEELMKGLLINIVVKKRPTGVNSSEYKKWIEDNYRDIIENQLTDKEIFENFYRSKGINLIDIHENYRLTNTDRLLSQILDTNLNKYGGYVIDLSPFISDGFYNGFDYYDYFSISLYPSKKNELKKLKNGYNIGAIDVKDLGIKLKKAIKDKFLKSISKDPESKALVDQMFLYLDSEGKSKLDPEIYLNVMEKKINSVIMKLSKNSSYKDKDYINLLSKYYNYIKGKGKKTFGVEYDIESKILNSGFFLINLIKKESPDFYESISKGKGKEITDLSASLGDLGF
jgi:hypothetical protein